MSSLILVCSMFVLLSVLVLYFRQKRLLGILYKKLKKKDEIIKKQTIKLQNSKIKDKIIYDRQEVISNYDLFIEKAKKKKMFRISEVMDRFFSLFDFEKSNIKTIYTIKDDITIHGYKDEVVQILLHLARNSKDAFKKRDIEKRYFFIDIQADDKTYTITIKDTAGGIEEYDLKKIFDPNYTTKNKSYGLGLYMVDTIMKEQKDTKIEVKNIEFENSIDGEVYSGVEFSFGFPRVYG